MYGQQERHRCFEYDTRVYATYGAPEDTTVYVSAQLTGRNEWIAGEWTGNEYREWAHTELLGRGAAGTSCGVNWKSEAAAIGANPATRDL